MNRRDLFTLAGKVGLVALASQVPWAWLERAGMVADYFAQAGALPQNYLVQTGSVLCDTSLGLSGIVGHQVHDGTATWAVSEVTDSTYLRPSGTSKAFRAEVTAAAPTGNSTYRFDFLINTSLVNIRSFHQPIHYTGDTGATMIWYVAQETGFSNYYVWNHVVDTNQFGAWTNLDISRHLPSQTVGSPSIGNTFVRLRCLVRVPATKTGVFYVGPIHTNWYSHPTVSITFDDGWNTDYTEAFTFMQTLGLVGSSAINGPGNTLVTTPLSVSQINEMQSAGWSFHNHTYSHTNLSTVNQSVMRQEIQDCTTYFSSLGIHLDPNVFVLPQGGRNDDVDAVLREFGYTYSMLSIGPGVPLFWGVPNPLRVPRVFLESSNLAAVKSSLDTAERLGHSLIFYAHKIGTATMTQADFRSYMREIALRRDQNRVTVRNLTDLFSGLTRPRLRRVS